MHRPCNAITDAMQCNAIIASAMKSRIQQIDVLILKQINPKTRVSNREPNPANRRIDTQTNLAKDSHEHSGKPNPAN